MPDDQPPDDQTGEQYWRRLAHELDAEAGRLDAENRQLRALLANPMLHVPLIRIPAPPERILYWSITIDRLGFVTEVTGWMPRSDD
jgi:hypothetical protein